MPNIYGNFSDQNPDILTGQIQTSNNNQTALNATIAETDQVRGSSVILQPTGLLANPTNDLPNVSAAAQGDIGAALGGVGQEGSASTQPGGGGHPPCFVGETRFSLLSDEGVVHYVPMMSLWLKKSQQHYPDKALSFDGERRVQGVIEEVTRSIAHTLLHVTFSHNWTSDLVTPEHPYWTGEKYVPIRDLLGQMVFTEDGERQKVVMIDEVTSLKGIPVFNAHIRQYQNYCANKRRVHNLCPLEGQPEPV